MALLLGSCRAPLPAPIASSVPIVVVGDGVHGIVLGQALVGFDNQAATCLRASHADEWRQLRQVFGGELGELAANHAELAVEQLVAVPLAGVQLLSIVVSSEEGVDVITLDTAVRHGGPDYACLLRLDRRRAQLAIIMRDSQRGEERTQAVFPGL